MHAWLKGTLISALAFGGSWSGAVWYWRGTNRMPATAELATYLVALPLALLLGYWLARKGAAAWRARQSAAADAGGPAAGDAAQAAHAAAVPAAPPPLAIAAAALHVPHGAGAPALAAALAKNQARPDLDKELYDEDGYPVMSARAGGVDEQAIENDMTLWLNLDGEAALYARSEFWRAMALATPVLRELAAAAALHPLAVAAIDAHDGGGQGAPAPTDRHAQQALNAVPMLQLIALLPPEWNSQWRDVAGRWLKRQAAGAGWPEQRIALSARPDHHPGPVLAALQQGTEPCLAIVLACASHVGNATVDAWATSGRLFTAARPQGAMPGEGAAGLLLADAQQASLLGGALYPLLAAVAADERPDDVAQARSGDCALLVRLARLALKPLEQAANAGPAGVPDTSGATPAAPPPPEVQLIVADTGHRTARVMELMAASHALQPQLDLAQDVLALGNATGDAGSAGFLAALALGRHEAQERGAPVLCLANDDSYLRCAALIRPAASATSAPPAPTPA